MAGIARELNERRVLCPSGADPGRNRHRSGQAWNLRTVAVILANPRYTGREVWRRHQCETPGGGGRVTPVVWAISTSLAHPALVGEADFVAVQQIRAARVNDDGVARRYLLAGLIRCGLCWRLMDAHWVNGRAGYRCRHGHNSALPAPPQPLLPLLQSRETGSSGLTQATPCLVLRGSSASACRA